jgi:geranylgeranyl pyrophosphate synthase
MPDFNETLDVYGREIEERLRRFFHGKILEADGYHEFTGRVYRMLEDYVLRNGKRLASCSTLMVYKGYDGEMDERILNTCVGIELYRHGILVHDDLADADDLRRGGKAFHKIFEEISGRFGNGTAVFAGNILYAISLDVISDSGFSEDLVNKVISLINSDYCAVNESQTLDLLFEYKEPDVEEWYQMASKRAASLFRATMLTGAVLAEAPGDEIKTLKEIASNIGYAFDIQDDIIGTFAAEEDYGRSTKGDIISGKKPLHIVYAFQKAPPGDAEKLRRILGNTKAGEAEIKTAKEILGRYGLEQAKARSREHANRAINLLDETKMNQETKEFFKDFIKYTAESLEWYK